MQRTVVVSGGGTGIGRAVARAFASGGDRVVIIGRRAETLAATAKAINGELADQRVHWTAADLTDPGQVAEAADAVLAVAPHVDVIVNNAGGNVGRDLPDGDLAAVAAAWRADYDANVLTTVLLTRALQPVLRRPGGRVIAIGSVAAQRGAGAYGAAKAALHAWVYDLAQQLGPDGITVNVVTPGFVPDTEFWAGRVTDDVVASRLAITPVRRPGTPDEVAAAVMYLASPDAGFTTGQVLGVNGGMVLGR